MLTQIPRILWAYRGFILGSVKREYQLKYKNSILGATWTVLNPLAMIVIYTVIFSQIMKARLPGAESAFAYSIYLCAGVLTWGMFQEITTRATGVFLENANLIKKLNFPRVTLPVIVVLTALLNFSIISTLFLVFLTVVGDLPGLAILGAFPVLLLQIVFSIGLGMTLGVLNVFFRDVGQFFSIAITFWFWLTPIVYPVSLLPETIRDLVFYLNPMAPIIDSYHQIFVYGTFPDWRFLVVPALFSVAICTLGLKLFIRHAGEMVDEL